MTIPLHRRDFLKHSAALAAAPALRATRLLAAPGAVTSDARSFLVNGKRTLILCGEMHYGRSPRQLWPALLDRSKALGINTIATYVFWNLHEPTRDTFNFTGDSDLRHFLVLCRQRGLNVFLRVGPYDCAEWNFGGFPSWLRDEPGITIRTMSQPYLIRVEKFFRHLSAEISPELASQGGSVILIQVENEYANVAKRYGAPGQEYLKWMVDLANRVGLGAVPLVECEGGAPGAIETGNGDTFPAEKIAPFRAKAPNAPLFWSESYPGWYELWGGQSHTPRDPRAIAFDTLDFVAGGGSGFNYYMWHGGTNFGRTSMYLQTTSYDFHAPLDEFGRPTLMGVYFGRMHQALARHADLILYGNYGQSTLPSGILQTTWTTGNQTLTLLTTKPDGDTRTYSTRLLAPTGESLFDVDQDFLAAQASFRPAAWTTIPLTLHWQSHAEPLPANRTDAAVSAPDPVEQLTLTHDRTDYCWYSTTLDLPTSAARTLTIPYGGDFFYLFVDGKLLDQTPTPLEENRGPITPEDPAHPRIVANRHETEGGGFHHEFALPAMPPGSHRIDLLSAALGMVKGDWQIASPMNFERKGIWEGVLLDGVPVKNWQMRPFLTGEIAGAATVSGPARWHGLQPAAEPARLTWHHTTFPLPATHLAADADFRLNAAGLGKGMLWVNGRCLGRHWLLLDQGTPPKPSQQHYHIPQAWLAAHNEIIVFEEQNRTPTQVTLEIRSYA